MTFKQQLQKDLSVFLNIDEFAEPHNIDGQDILCMVDESGDTERSRQSVELYTVADGIYQTKKSIYVRPEDYEKPIVGYRMRLDGEFFYVTAAAIEDGLLRIEISANEV